MCGCCSRAACGSRAGIARARASRQLGVQHLEGHRAVVPEVPGEVDRGHAAAAELALDPRSGRAEPRGTLKVVRSPGASGGDASMWPSAPRSASYVNMGWTGLGLRGRENIAQVSDREARRIRVRRAPSKGFPEWFREHIGFIRGLSIDIGRDPGAASPRLRIPTTPALGELVLMLAPVTRSPPSANAPRAVDRLCQAGPGAASSGRSHTVRRAASRTRCLGRRGCIASTRCTHRLPVAWVIGEARNHQFGSSRKQHGGPGSRQIGPEVIKCLRVVPHEGPHEKPAILGQSAEGSISGCPPSRGRRLRALSVCPSSRQHPRDEHLSVSAGRRRGHSGFRVSRTIRSREVPCPDRVWVS